MAIQVVQQLPKVGRKLRNPSHSFQIRQQPFVIQPMLIAPVLPGETMKNLLLQARAVSDPIKNPIVGWWHEYYFFYVKLRDLSVRAEIEKMFLDPAWDWNTAPGMKSVAAAVNNYFCGNGIDWVQKCLEVVVREYFRNEDEDWNTFTLGGLPVASIMGNGWMDSLIPRSNLAPAEDMVVNPSGSDLLASEVDVAMRQYAMLKLNGLVQQSFEDYLATHGVSVGAAEDPYRPELVRYIRDWTYPTNTIDPANGTPRSAVSWSVAERADKDRFFKEPGFLCGYTVTRPKTYFRNQSGNASWFLRNVRAWLPFMLQDDPYASLQEVDGATVNPLSLSAAGNNFVMDARDLFIYGDQFCNFDRALTDANMIPGPEATTFEHRYVTNQAQVDELFVTAGTNKIKIDGVVSLSILGRQVDTTPSEAMRT